MKGSYDIVVKNNRLQYKFTIQRNITILRGDSATGKTTLIEMIRNFNLDGIESGIEVICQKKCVTLERRNWQRDLESIRDSIVFIDEGNSFVKSKSFADMIQQSDNYYVIATRESLFSLPYSINEIYGIKNAAGNRYMGTKRVYSHFIRLYNAEAFKGKPDKVIVEDSNSAYHFFNELCRKEKIPCESAKGKSNIFTLILNSNEDKVLVIADGAAFGPEVERVMSLKNTKNVILFLPESFEWLVLKSGLVKEIKDLKKILNDPAAFIESDKYFSWERFFTQLLIDGTKDTVFTYQKSKLNPAYLHEKSQKAIVDTIDQVAGIERE